jgi:hypothetical protein
MWYIFQGLIIFAVVASNIHWQWTPNPYAAGVCGYLAAYLLTAAVARVFAAITSPARARQKYEA